MKAVVSAFNQEKALVGAFSVITNIRMQLFEAPLHAQRQEHLGGGGGGAAGRGGQCTRRWPLCSPVVGDIVMLWLSACSMPSSFINILQNNIECHQVQGHQRIL